MSATTHNYTVNANPNSRPASSFAAEQPSVSGISGKEIHQAAEIRADSAPIQVPQAIIEPDTEKDEKSQTETSIAV